MCITDTERSVPIPLACQLCETELAAIDDASPVRYFDMLMTARFGYSPSASAPIIVSLRDLAVLACLALSVSGAPMAFAALPADLATSLETASRFWPLRFAFEKAWDEGTLINATAVRSRPIAEEVASWAAARLRADAVAPASTAAERWIIYGEESSDSDSD